MTTIVYFVFVSDTMEMLLLSPCDFSGKHSSAKLDLLMPSWWDDSLMKYATVYIASVEMSTRHSDGCRTCRLSPRSCHRSWPLSPTIICRKACSISTKQRLRVMKMLEIIQVVKMMMRLV
ncbi:hypothetical protein B296_00025026 [Ensete ventricosum]|uniref:Uncharacterized protein n=1 Tax=Ensete ventricosum TaxID=4639 RepID=A0A426Z2I2_ENSVE|nr:hypothetical protein B296_00025026 [Ensete ventricosum]